MSRTLTLPDDLYERLEYAAKQQGMDKLQWLARTLPPHSGELSQLERMATEMDALRTAMEAKYGVQPDSVPLIREDRDR